MIEGSCLCGGIKFQVEPIPEKTYNCHCSLCRKAHGAAFATQVFAKGETLKFIQGEELLKEYQGPVGIRAFCSNCGSRLMNFLPDKTRYLSIALASIDSDTNIKPVSHAFAASKLDWVEPSKDIPCYDEMPAGAFD